MKITAMICAMIVVSSVRAGAFCDACFKFRREKVCGPDFNISIDNRNHEKSAIENSLLFGVSADEVAKAATPSVRNAFYPLAGFADYKSDFRTFGLRKENYMVSLIFPLSSLGEQYDALKLLIEERRNPGASNTAPGALP